jgi:hypothetical protein
MAAATAARRPLEIENLPASSVPCLWLGSPLKTAEESLFARSLGNFVVSDGRGEIAADQLYAGLNHLLLRAWKAVRPARAAILEKHFQQGGRIIASILEDRLLRQSIADTLVENAGYKSAFYIEPPHGNGAVWLDRFDRVRGLLLERHLFGESAHGPLVTVDPAVERKFVRLTDREKMLAAVGIDRLTAWERKYLVGCSVDAFLDAPPPEAPYRIDAPFFAEGHWYLPELRTDYDAGMDNLIVVDATSERWFSQALDELATYGCRYARLIVVSQTAFRKDPAKSGLYRYPISHLISIPGLPGADGAPLPVSDYLLPFALNLIAAAMASATILEA